MEYIGSICFHQALEEQSIQKGVTGHLIPVYGDIPCGEPKFVDDELHGYLEIPYAMLGTGEYFVLRAKGDSMIGAGINNGDLVIVKKQNYAEVSQIVVAFVNGETTLKRFYKNGEQKLIELRPENDDYPPIYASECLILGIAVKTIKDI